MKWKKMKLKENESIMKIIENQAYNSNCCENIENNERKK